MAEADAPLLCHVLQHPSELFSSPVQPAHHRADRNAHHFRDLFVRHALHVGVVDRDSLVFAELSECVPHLVVPEGGQRREFSRRQPGRRVGRLRGELDAATAKWGLRISRVELKAIDPPPSIQQSMEMQMKADREKRAMILTAEGRRESDIKTAEGEKQARILSAEGEKHAAILAAEAERQAMMLRAEGERAAKYLAAQGEARAIQKVNAAIKSSGVTPELLAYQYLEQLPKIANNDAATMWMIPSQFGDSLQQFARAFANKDELKGSFVENTSRDSFLLAMNISAFSFVDVSRRAAKLMPNGGSLITLTYLGSERVIPNYNTMDVAKAVGDIKGGKIDFRVDRNANLHFIIGKASFTQEQLVENFRAAVEEIVRLKPSSSKGRYISKLTVATTFGPGVPVDPSVAEK